MAKRDEKLKVAVAAFPQTEALKRALAGLAALGVGPGDMTVLAERMASGSDEEDVIMDLIVDQIVPAGENPRGRSPAARPDDLDVSADIALDYARWMSESFAAYVRDHLQGCDYVLFVLIRDLKDEAGICRLLLSEASDFVHVHETSRRPASSARH